MQNPGNLFIFWYFILILDWIINHAEPEDGGKRNEEINGFSGIDLWSMTSERQTVYRNVTFSSLLIIVRRPRVLFSILYRKAVCRPVYFDLLYVTPGIPSAIL
jgi:hypothetical protein